jgi:hypothetical protein
MTPSTSSAAERALPRRDGPRRALALLASTGLALTSALFAIDARADGDDAFRRGRDLLDRGLVSEACEALGTAEHDKPTVGTIGLLAACHEKQGRLATAFREYQEAARRAAAAHDDRERFAAERAAKLEPTVPRLVLHLPKNEKLAVTVRGEPLDPSTSSAALRLDPGAVEVVATSPEGRTWKTSVALEPSEERVVEVPSLAPAKTDRPPRRSAAPPWPALVAGGVGLAAVGMTTGFGIAAMTQNADSVSIEARCKAGTTTAAECARGKAERSHARTYADVATGGAVVSAAALGTAVLLWALHVGAPSTEAPRSAAVKPEPWVSPTGAGFGLTGAF